MPIEIPILVLALTVFLVGGLAIFWFIRRELQRFEQRQKQDEALKLVQEWIRQTNEQANQLRLELQGRLDRNTDTLQNRLDKTNRDINLRLDKAAEVIGGVQKGLGQVAEINRRMAEFQEALRAPKLRGEIGETIMYDLLKQIIPQANLAFQHEFRSGATVDAVIRTSSGIIPIDSKFPIENFKRMMQAKSEEERKSAQHDFHRDIKKHIADVGKKYILPDEGTCNFAWMYIHSEAIAYEIIVNHPDLVEYARQQRISLVSPNQFNHLLQIVYGTLQLQRINEQTQQVLKLLQRVQTDSQKFGDEFRVLVKHISHAKNMADSASISFEQLSSKIDSMQRLEQTSPPQELTS